MKTPSCFFVFVAILTTAFVLQPPEAWADDCSSAPGNLVQNCGFETGDTTGWTYTPAAIFADFGIRPGVSYQGNYAAQFAAFAGPTGDYANYDTLSQSLATTVGQQYDLTFWIASSEEKPNADFVVDWGGSQVDDISAENLPLGVNGALDYVEVSLLETASSSSTVLSFAGWDAPAGYFLDDISVTPSGSPVPEPSSILLLLTGLAGLGEMIRRRVRA